MSKEKEQLSPEELQKYKDEMVAFYKEEIPRMTLVRDYENLLAEAEEARARRMFATMKMAQIAAETQKEPAKRNLKKEEEKS